MFITAKIAFIFMYLIAVHMYNFHIFTVIYSSPHGFIWNQHNDQLRWLRRGHGLKSRTCLYFFFQAFFPLLLKLCSLVRRSLSYSPKLIVPQSCCILPPTQHHSFFKKLTPFRKLKKVRSIIHWSDFVIQWTFSDWSCGERLFQSF